MCFFSRGHEQSTTEAVSAREARRRDILSIETNLSVASCVVRSVLRGTGVAAFTGMSKRVVQSELKRRDRSLEMLSDTEVAGVSSAETATRLVEGFAAGTQLA